MSETKSKSIGRTLAKNLPVLVSVICIGLYFCPFNHVVSFDHEAYLNVFKSRDTPYIWILGTSCTLFLLSIVLTILGNFKFFDWKGFRIALYSLYFLSLIFFALSFVFAFCFSNNGIK